MERGWDARGKGCEREGCSRLVMLGGVGGSRGRKAVVAVGVVEEAGHVRAGEGAGAVWGNGGCCCLGQHHLDEGKSKSIPG